MAAADLAADRVAAQKRRLYADKTVGKVATDEHTFDEFVSEQGVAFEAGSFPSTETMVEFAAWL